VLGGFDHCEGNGHGFAAAFRAGEHPVFAPDGYGLDDTFSDGDVHLPGAVVEIRHAWNIQPRA